MYGESAAIYDAIYGARHPYAAKAAHLTQLIRERKRSTSSFLLDVACGTGAYLVHLMDIFEVEGLDASPEMTAIARKKLPGVSIHNASMVDFDLGRQFDVIVCLGSSIGYVQTVENLRQTLATFARHLKPGGVVIVEPWISPDVWENGRVTAELAEVPDLKVAMILVSGLQGTVSTLDIHHLVAQGTAVHYFTEHHELGLFSREQHLAAFQDAGLNAEHDSEGLMGRGLYMGTKPL
jgi:SAM-dependent methyltransferase